MRKKFMRKIFNLQKLLCVYTYGVYRIGGEVLDKELVIINTFIWNIEQLIDAPSFAKI